MKKQTPKTILALSIIISFNALANPGYYSHDPVGKLETKLAVFATDILIGSLVAGISASAQGEDFWPAAAKGALGGMINYAAKEVLLRQDDFRASGAMAKVMSAIGQGIVYNTARDPKRGMLHHLELRVGPAALVYDADSGFDYAVYPLTVGFMAFQAANGIKLNMEKTLLALTPYYEGYVFSDPDNIPGLCLYDTITIAPFANIHSVYQHEMIHVIDNTLLTGWVDHSFAGLFDDDEVNYILTHMRIMGDLASLVSPAISAIGDDVYWNNPLEIRARAMSDM